MKYLGTATILLTALAVTTTVSTPSPSMALTWGSSGGLGSLPVSEPAPAGTTPRDVDHWPTELDQGATLDATSAVAVTEVLARDSRRRINTVTWESTSDKMHFYIFDVDDDLRSLISAALPVDQAWDVIPAQRPVAELERVIEELASRSDLLPVGVTFSSGKPSPDGASITVGVDVRTPRVLRGLPLPAKIGDVPVKWVSEKPATATARVRDVAPVVSGGYMQGPTSAGQRYCTAGFPVLRNQDSQYNMITADHCSDQQGSKWTWGNGSHSVGTSTFQAAGDTDLELYIEPESLSTWVFVGGYTDASSVVPIRGYTAPVGGNSVCYSGSRSGLVCSNVLESTDTYNCVALLQCYWTRWSSHSSGTAAAGNGDSGGPVIMAVKRTSDNTVGAYGVGVISMINLDKTTACTGEPGGAGRNCSANVGFAPLSRWVSSQTTHSLVYTTS